MVKQRASRPSPQARSKALRKKSAKARTEPPRVVVGVGLATVDLLFVSPRIDERLVDASVFSMQAGGSASNMLATLAVMGEKTRFFGRIANDEHGHFILRSMQNLRIDTSMLLVEKD